MSKNITKWLLTGILALASSALAQQQASPAGQQSQQGIHQGLSGQQSPQATSQAGAMQDGVVMRDRDVYFIKNGQPQRIEKETHLSEGITVDEDGNVTLKDGTKTKLTDNQMITLDGQLRIAPPAMGQRGAFQSPSPARSTRDTGREESR